MNKEIFIAGGTGLVGSRLTEMLLEKGYSVTLLSRKPKTSKRPNLHILTWDPSQGVVPNEICNAQAVVNLAGANVSEKRWTDDFKKTILNSRVDSTRALINKLNECADSSLKCYVNASAIGYYGADRKELLKEEASPGTDFMSVVCQAWEKEANQGNLHSARRVILRIGIVLSSREGALKEMIKPFSFYAGAPLGSGTQITPWIHLDDLCGIILYVIENQSVQGTYNAVGPNPVTNSQLTKAIGKALKKPVLLPPVPLFALRLMVGELADSVAASFPVSSARIQQAGYTFQHSNVEKAVKDLIKSGK